MQKIQKSRYVRTVPVVLKEDIDAYIEKRSAMLVLGLSDEPRQVEVSDTEKALHAEQTVLRGKNKELMDQLAKLKEQNSAKQPEANVSLQQAENMGLRKRIAELEHELQQIKASRRAQAMGIIPKTIDPETL